MHCKMYYVAYLNRYFVLYEMEFAKNLYDKFIQNLREMSILPRTYVRYVCQIYLKMMLF